MDINITLVLQMLVFVAFVWFTMRSVWPPLVRAMEDRQEKIAAGLSAAERGHKELELAQCRAKEKFRQAKAEAAEVIEYAHNRAAMLIDEAKSAAKLEAQRQIQFAREQLAQEVYRAKEILRQQVATLAIAAAEKILMREIDKEKNTLLVDKMLQEFCDVS